MHALLLECLLARSLARLLAMQKTIALCHVWIKFNARNYAFFKFSNKGQRPRPKASAVIWRLPNSKAYHRPCPHSCNVDAGGHSVRGKASMLFTSTLHGGGLPFESCEVFVVIHTHTQHATNNTPGRRLLNVTFLFSGPGKEASAGNNLPDSH